jgi:hypothetical protein
VQSNAIIKYDRVLTNWGGAYQPSAGVFTAPYNGLYSISCSMMAHPDNVVYAAIKQNGEKVSVLYSNSGTFPQTSQTVQLKLKKGDTITIQNNGPKAAKIHDHGSYNIFSGFLIAEIL